MIKEVVDELESALEWCAEDDNPNESVAVKIWAVRKALEFLKPRPPAFTELEYLVNGMPVVIRHPECPRCRESGLTLWDAEIPRGQRFCGRCGQKVEWKEEEKQND